jgi:polyisoprenoid-binding protein YceI
MSRKTVGIVASVAVAFLLIGVGGWYLFFRDDAPPEVDIDRATEGIDDTTGSSLDGDDLSGTWVVDASIGSFDDFTSAFAGYRVNEELGGIGANTATGRTPDVTGVLTVEGTTVQDGEIEVDMTTLQSDDDRRDGAISRNGLETATFPTATFVLTDPVDIGALPDEGATSTVTASGDLTLHGVTQPVQIPLEIAVEGEVVVVTGSLEILMADYQITPPRIGPVVSIEDKGVIELQLFFTRG